MGVYKSPKQIDNEKDELIKLLKKQRNDVMQICEGWECLVGSSIGVVKLMTRLHFKGCIVRPPFANVLLCISKN